jgi:ATP-dependent exoDNAse (exonuclease V) beta subunit
VALTRARDRLYLGSVVKEGRFQPTRGSLGEVLPPSLHSVFVEAAAGMTSVSWTGASRSHVMSVCPTAGLPTAGLKTRRYDEQIDAEVVAGRPYVEAGLQTRLEDQTRQDKPGSDFAVVKEESVQRVTVSELSDIELGAAPALRGHGQGSDRWIGIVVHRLLQRTDWAAESSDEDLRQVAKMILRTVIEDELGDLEALIEDSVARFRQISSQADVRELYRLGRPFHEVPFTMQVDDRIVRGTIDCLIASSDRVTVLEFKTGRPRNEHRAQAEVYRIAAQALFPGVPAESRLVYTSDSGVA